MLPSSTKITFKPTQKKINNEQGLHFWLRSKAYNDITTFILQLNIAMFPTKTTASPSSSETKDQSAEPTKEIEQLRNLITKLEDMINEAPPDPGPRRFGNISFRKWHQLVASRIDEMLQSHLSERVVQFSRSSSAVQELKDYLMASFGSEQRLDYGTGHELNFLAFLGGIWKLGGFTTTTTTTTRDVERMIVLEVVRPYLKLIRRLILTYNLEPAGSHGVWGLDDHSFVPYIFGSAQLAPAISDTAGIPGTGSWSQAPSPSDVTKAGVVNEWRERNLYFGAIGFIYDVKRGPFWEHSRTLFDISGITAGWAKINKVSE